MANSAQNKAIHSKDKAGGDTMIESHLKKLSRKKADAFNLGHTVSNTSIGSKTDKGYLKTTMKGGACTHKWS